MNLADGSVEIAAEGEQRKLDELRQKAARGPDGAEVSEIIDLPAVEGLLDVPFGVRKGRNG
jgi:acylphosphatase